VAALAEAGANPVSVAQSSSSELPDHPGETICLDLEDGDAVNVAMSGIDLVIHLAARAGGIQFQDSAEPDVFSTNRTITDNLLASCARANIAKVFLASSLVTYRASSEPLTETHPQLGPVDRPSPYAWSKITDEVVASWEQDIGVVIGRFGNVYGPGAPFDAERSTVVHALIDRAARLPDGGNMVVWGDGTAVRSFVFVEDAAQAVLIAVEKGQPGEPYNIDGGKQVNIAQLAEMIRDQVNPSLDLGFDPSQSAGAPFRVGTIDKLTALGYVPAVTMEDGVRRTVAWYRTNVLIANET
jgi:GDP-L-fucose synthase